MLEAIPRGIPQSHEGVQETMSCRSCWVAWEAMARDGCKSHSPEGDHEPEKNFQRERVSSFAFLKDHEGENMLAELPSKLSHSSTFLTSLVSVLPSFSHSG